MWSPVRLIPLRMCETNVYISVWNKNGDTFFRIVSFSRFPFLTHGCSSLRSLAHSNCANFKNTGAKLFCIWHFLSAAFFGIFICCFFGICTWVALRGRLSKGHSLKRQTLYSMLAVDQHFSIPNCISTQNAYAVHTTFIYCIRALYMFY